jgi:hypothetical protein
MIERVEGISAKLQIHSLVQRNEFSCANVPIVDSRPSNNIRCGISEVARCWLNETGGIDTKAFLIVRATINQS